MSSSTKGIPFSLAHHQSNFRLLELPEELLHLLTAPDPPSLHIKSKDSGPHVLAGKPSLEPAFAVLCTHDKTYKITQVSTSNSVYIAQPTRTPLEDDEMDMKSGGISIVGACPTTIELRLTAESAAPYLRQLLPECNIYTVSNSPTGSELQTVSVRKETLYSNIPLSKSEIDSEWLRLCCFETMGSCYRPAANVLESGWKTIIQTAIANDIVLDNEHSVHALSSLTAGQDPNQKIPPELYDAIIGRLRDPVKEQALSSHVTAVWTAEVALESRAPAKMPREDFMLQWKALLPYYWENKASWEVVKDIADLTDPLNITLNNSLTSHNVATPPVQSKKRWHAHFGSNK